MKKTLLLFTAMLSFILNSKAQVSIYKGLLYGMTQNEAKTEFKTNKIEYKGIDLGNNFTYNIYSQNFTYENGKLVSLLLTPSGSTFGQSYNDVVNYLTYSKTFFDSLGYEIFLEPTWWKAPQMFNSTNSKYGLVLINKDKTIVTQLYPITYDLSGSTKYLVKLHIYNYNWWMDVYNKEIEKQSNVKKDSGF